MTECITHRGGYGFSKSVLFIMCAYTRRPSFNLSVMLRKPMTGLATYLLYSLEERLFFLNELRFRPCFDRLCFGMISILSTMLFPVELSSKVILKAGTFRCPVLITCFI